jgi:hypothetical protein
VGKLFAERRRVKVMSIIEVPALPFRAGRHLVTWIVWHTAQVSWVDDDPQVTSTAPPPKRSSSSAAA